jgi:hypothetical protein
MHWSIFLAPDQHEPLITFVVEFTQTPLGKVARLQGLVDDQCSHSLSKAIQARQNLSFHVTFLFQFPRNFSSDQYR